MHVFLCRIVEDKVYRTSLLPSSQLKRRIMYAIRICSYKIRRLLNKFINGLAAFIPGSCGHIKSKDIQLNCFRWRLTLYRIGLHTLFGMEHIKESYYVLNLQSRCCTTRLQSPIVPLLHYLCTPNIYEKQASGNNVVDQLCFFVSFSSFKSCLLTLTASHIMFYAWDVRLESAFCPLGRL